MHVSHNLDVAIDIADAVIQASGRRLSLNVRRLAEDLIQRHHVPGLSHDQIASAVKQEGEAAGVATE